MCFVSFVIGSVKLRYVVCSNLCKVISFVFHKVVGNFLVVSVWNANKCAKGARGQYDLAECAVRLSGGRIPVFNMKCGDGA